MLGLGDLFNFSDLSTFTQNIPVEWVSSALELSSQATIRRHRLPSDHVLWLVLGMVLFRDEPVHEVTRRLNICAQGLASLDLPARSGISQAHARLGAGPVEDRFRKCGQPWGANATPTMTGRVCRCWPLTVPCCASQTPRNCVRILARATRVPNGRRLAQQDQ